MPLTFFLFLVNFPRVTREDIKIKSAPSSSLEEGCLASAYLLRASQREEDDRNLKHKASMPQLSDKCCFLTHRTTHHSGNTSSTERKMGGVTTATTSKTRKGQKR
jgi:hypothetical protein